MFFLWQPMGCVFILCVCETERYKKKVTIDIYTQNGAKLRNNGGMPNSLCQKMDCYHQYHMELIISKELECQVIHNTAPKWNNVLFFLWSVKGASSFARTLVTLSTFHCIVPMNYTDLVISQRLMEFLKSLVLSFLLVMCLHVVK